MLQQSAAQGAGGADGLAGQPDHAGPAGQVVREAAITVQALLALNWPEGKCARAWSLRSRIVSSTTACWRCSASTTASGSVRLVRNGKWRQSGHSSAWAPDECGCV